MPGWLTGLAQVSLALAALSAVVIVIHLVAGHRQRMWIMNLVWPISALYAGPLALWAYFRWGARAAPGAAMPPSHHQPHWQTVATGTLHCGSGCTLGDIVAEWLLYLVPVSLFGRRIFAAWTVAYLLALLFGIAFQYFTLEKRSVGQGLRAALKADTLSLTAWQVGMYGWMAVVVFGIVGHELSPTDPIFWFMMQIAMLIGFLTSYPVNAWLIARGIKTAM